MNRVTVAPGMLAWACERAGISIANLQNRFPRLAAWDSGEAQPTLKQLEAFAKAVHVPIGYLFLPKPLEEPVPIPDLRTPANRALRRPSPDLLDTVYLCQQQQHWYREFARQMGEPAPSFVESVRLGDDIVDPAAAIRTALGFDIVARRRMPNWTEALRGFIAQADELGVLVMVSGVVGSNNRRRLAPNEFRGLALADSLAPLVFVNGADTKAAQMFTLAHELAHVWLGQTALSDVRVAIAPVQAVERWCNEVAAELLVPIRALREAHDSQAELRPELDRLARRFKVSTLVILRRMRDAGTLGGDAYWRAYEDEIERLRSAPRGTGGRLLSDARCSGKQTLRARVGREYARRSLVVHGGFPVPRLPQDGRLTRPGPQSGSRALMAYLLDANRTQLVPGQGVAK